MKIILDTERGFRFELLTQQVPGIGDYINVSDERGEHRLVVRKVSWDMTDEPLRLEVEEQVGNRRRILEKVFIQADYR